jgi:hypothetical protein
MPIYMAEHRAPLQTAMGERNVNKLIIALMISAAFIVSGISATTFSTGQLTTKVWADGGAGD